MVTATQKKKSATEQIAAPVIPEVTGYGTNLSYFATRYKQGGRTIFSLDLSLDEIMALIPQPDPSVLTPGNRAIRPAHAAGFGKYLREREHWISPAMILRAASAFDFEPISGVGVDGVEFGVASFPRLAAMDIHILDGQHRTLGIYLAHRGISEDLDKARSALASARRQDPGGAAVKEAERRIKELQKQRERLSHERMSVQIYIESDPVAYKQMFFDIADNALGITSSVKARFDSTKVVNRALEAVLEHPLLQARVDPESDRVGRGSPYLMGAKHVAEVVRSVQVGLDGRVSRRQESEFKEQDIAKKVHAFFDTIVEAFPPMKAVVLGQLLPENLRKSSLLGSVLMVRVLAGVYHELIANHAFDDEMVRKYFTKLAKHMEAPVYEDSIWMKHIDGNVFTDGGLAPHGRRQDLKLLRETLTAWAIDKPKFVDQKPLPRPEPEPTEEDDPEYGAGYVVDGVKMEPMTQLL